MAAALGSYLAVCSGSTIQLLDLNPQFGQVNIVQVFKFLQQVSAVSCFQAGKGPEEVRLPRQHKPCLLKLSWQCSLAKEKIQTNEQPHSSASFPIRRLTKRQLNAFWSHLEIAHVSMSYNVPILTMPPAHRLGASSMVIHLLLSACRQVQPGWLLGSGCPTLWSCASCPQMGALKLCTLGPGSLERCLQPT